MSDLANTLDVLPARNVADELVEERIRQHAKFGDQQHMPDGTGGVEQSRNARNARMHCQVSFGADRGTWHHVLAEEFHEAMAESDPAALRAELIQVAAVAVAWVEAIDKR